MVRIIEVGFTYLFLLTGFARCVPLVQIGDNDGTGANGGVSAMGIGGRSLDSEYVAVPGSSGRVDLGQYCQSLDQNSTDCQSFTDCGAELCQGGSMPSLPGNGGEEVNTSPVEENYPNYVIPILQEFVGDGTRFLERCYPSVRAVYRDNGLGYEDEESFALAIQREEEGMLSKWQRQCFDKASNVISGSDCADTKALDHMRCCYNDNNGANCFVVRAEHHIVPGTCITTGGEGQLPAVERALRREAVKVVLREYYQEHYRDDNFVPENDDMFSDVDERHLRSCYPR
jgi:hypothetical protein